MQLTKDNNTSQYIIKAFDDHSVTVNDQIITTSLIISREALISPWEIQHFSDLTLESLACMTELKPDIILLGMGKDFRITPAPIASAFDAMRIATEPMSTASAIRTYAALSSEGRNVAAALILEA